MVQFFGLVFFR